MSMHEDVRLLRRDLDAIQNRVADISRRLGAIEKTCEQQGYAAEEHRLPSTPPPLPALSVAPAARTGNVFEDSMQLARTLNRAAREGDIPLAKQCLEGGANINQEIAYESPLDMAVEAGRIDMIRFLISNGAAIEHNFLIGKSQIRRARSLGFSAIAEFLEAQLAAKPGVAGAAVSTQTTLAIPAVPPAPSNLPGLGFIQQRLNEWLDEFRSKVRETGWEVQLGTYLLPRAAVLCIAIAVVFFLSLAVQRWGAQWMPYLRVGVGYAVCAGLMLLAWRSERKYTGLARVLYAGGFAVMYFVTFATHFVPFARIFASPYVTLALLAAIVLAWSIAAQLRQSKVIAVLVTALGHMTILLSTLTLDHPGPFSMAGIVFLSVGSAFFLLRNRWYYVASLGMAFSYLNDAIVLARSQGGNPHVDFIGSMSILSIFLLIFALAELCAPEELRRKVPSWFRTAFVTLNMAAFLLIGSIIMDSFDFTRHHMDIFRIVTAGVLAAFALAYLRARSSDPLHNVYFTAATALLTFGLATRYGGGTLSVWLAIEAVVLLVSARRSGLVVMRIMAFGIGYIAFAQSLSNAYSLALGVQFWGLGAAALLLKDVSYTAPQYTGSLVKAAVSVLAFLLSSQLYQRTDWSLRSPKPGWLSRPTQTMLWKLDLLSDKPDLSAKEKPFGGLLFPYLYAAAAAFLCVAYAFPLLHEGHRFAGLAAFALAMTAAAALLESKPFGLASTAVLLYASLGVATCELAGTGSVSVAAMLFAILAAACVALVSEESRFGKRAGLEFHQALLSPYLLYGACAWALGLFLVKEFPGVNAAFPLAATSVAMAGLFLLLHPTALAALAGGFALWSSLILFHDLPHYYHAAPGRCGLAVLILVGLALASDRFFSLFKERTPISRHLCAAFVVDAFIVLLYYFERRIPADWLMTATAAALYAALAYAMAFRSPAAAAVAIAGMAYASLRNVATAFDVRALHAGLVVAFVLLALFWILCERLWTMYAIRLRDFLAKIPATKEFDPARPENALAPIALATTVLLALLNRVPHLANQNLAFITIGWFVLAALLLVLSLPFHQRFYRYAGLAVIVLSLARLFFVDMKEQDPLLRVAAFAVVGGGLLCISVGYHKWMARVKEAKHETPNPSPGK